MSTPPGQLPSGPALGGELSGGSPTQPGNVGNIMQNMFSQMVTLEQVASGQTTVQAAPAQTPPVQNAPITTTPPARETVTVQPKVAEPDTNLFTDTPPEEVDAQQAAPDEEPDMSDIPDEPAKENWKKAREALKNERKTLKQINREYEATKQKLEKYEKGEIVPEIITAKDMKIQQLEKYETIVNGKLSEAYQTLVAEPIKQKSAALTKLAEDYSVPETIRGQLIQKIVESENERERNALITKYFPDAIGANKVESLVKDLHQIGEVALEMDNKPAETLQSLQAQYQAKKAEEAEQIASQFESVSKGAWNKALEKTAAEGLFPQLIMDPNNAEVSKVAEKNQHRAGIQYGALVKKLHENGLRTLPEDLATGLARSVQLAIGSVGIAKQLEAANKRIAELEGTSGMIATYMRPGVNSNGHGRPPVNTSNDKGPTNPKDAGQAALAVFNKR